MDQKEYSWKGEDGSDLPFDKAKQQQQSVTQKPLEKQHRAKVLEKRTAGDDYTMVKNFPSRCRKSQGK